MNSLNGVLHYYRMSLVAWLIRTNSFAATPTVDTLRESIFIPKWVTPALPSLPADETHAGPEWARTDHNRWYGTREQTVILISHEDGRVVFTERTLWDEAAQPLSIQDGETRVVFHIEGWET
jgi:uncharacterized protein with NRDE domain